MIKDPKILRIDQTPENIEKVTNLFNTIYQQSEERKDKTVTIIENLVTNLNLQEPTQEQLNELEKLGMTPELQNQFKPITQTVFRPELPNQFKQQIYHRIADYIGRLSESELESGLTEEDVQRLNNFLLLPPCKGGEASVAAEDLENMEKAFHDMARELRDYYGREDTDDEVPCWP